jgi:hypothetical protein
VRGGCFSNEPGCLEHIAALDEARKGIKTTRMTEPTPSGPINSTPVPSYYYPRYSSPPASRDFYITGGAGTSFCTSYPDGSISCAYAPPADY